MSNILEFTKTDNECTLCVYGKYMITIQTTNKSDKYIPTSINKEQAIQLRNFLNEFIGDEDGK